MKNINRAEMFKAVLKQSTTYTPIGPTTEVITQCMGICINFFKRLTIPYLVTQIEQQIQLDEQGDKFYRHELQVCMHGCVCMYVFANRETNQAVEEQGDMFCRHELQPKTVTYIHAGPTQSPQQPHQADA
jgi:hypothetical protein